MKGRRIQNPGAATWSVDAIPYDRVDRTAVCDDEQLFYVIASASFVEITSDLFTRSLIGLFEDDDEVVTWLRDSWEPEELQHGEALKRYVQVVWPEFDWESTYREFLGEYTPRCAPELLAPTRALEMAARCVVETGTASFYRMLAESTREPVLKLIASNIRTDEVRHYKHFFHAFERYRAAEGTGRAAVLRALLAEMAEIDSEDGYFAFKYVFQARNPGRPFDQRDYAAYRERIRDLARKFFPTDSAIKMLLKPLGLPALASRLLLPPVAAATRLLVLR